MRIIKIAMLLVVFFLFAALTPHEAQLYGSRILVCGSSGVIIKHWTAYQVGETGRKGTKSLVFDLMTKRSYHFNECEIYKCSPEPSRMKDCRLD